MSPEKHCEISTPKPHKNKNLHPTTQAAFEKLRDSKTHEDKTALAPEKELQLTRDSKKQENGRQTELCSNTFSFSLHGKTEVIVTSVLTKLYIEKERTKVSEESFLHGFNTLRVPAMEVSEEIMERRKKIETVHHAVAQIDNKAIDEYLWNNKIQPIIGQCCSQFLI